MNREVSTNISMSFDFKFYFGFKSMHIEPIRALRFALLREFRSLSTSLPSFSFISYGSHLFVSEAHVFSSKIISC